MTQDSYYLAMKAAFELGYRSCEKGMNLQASLDSFNKILSVAEVAAVEIVDKLTEERKDNAN